MYSAIMKMLGSMAMAFKPSVTDFCDLSTSNGDDLISRHGDRISVLRLTGMRRIALRSDIEAAAAALRLDLAAPFEGRGHALQICYVSDPSQAAGEIQRNLDTRRTIARGLHADFDDILAERARVLPRHMRWESCHMILWSRPALLTRFESKDAAESRREETKGMASFGDAQNPLRSSEQLAAKHRAFVQSVMQSFEQRSVGLRLLTPDEAVVMARTSIYPETAGTPWRPLLPGHGVMPTLQEDGEEPDLSNILWPPLAEQIFLGDAETQGSSVVRLGEFDWTGIDMSRGPEDPRPFAELASRLAGRHIPWRMSMLVEGSGPGLMAWKSAVASLLNFGGNREVKAGFDELQQIRKDQADVTVKMRTSFATWVPTGDLKLLRRQAASLHQGVESWGNSRAAALAGDPLEGVMSSAPAMAIASTAPPSAAPLSKLFRMMPWARPGAPWEEGAVLFRTPDGAIAPFDPAGSGRKTICDIFVAPSRYGKSVLSNTLLLGTILSNAAQTTDGMKLPLIGKLDIGESAEGLIDVVRQALPERLRHLAIYVAFELAPGFEYNVLDTQVGCRQPLPLDRSFIKNFLSLICLPIGRDEPFEGMDQMLGFVVDEVYRRNGDQGPNTSPKAFRTGSEHVVDAALAHHSISLPSRPTWWDVVDALAIAREWSAAEVANRRAVPVLHDLLEAVRTKAITDQFERVKAPTGETLPDVFARYLSSFIAGFPTLNRPTVLDFGPARIIVIDLRAVAPTGSDEAERKTDLMYLLGRQILARNFFLHPKYAADLPEPVREYHRKRFTEAFETFKRLEYDEYHRTKGRRYVRAQVELDRREGSKHNLHLGFSSQRLEDFGEDLISQSSGRFILGAGDEEERSAIINRFNLSPAAAEAVRTALTGPRPDGSGAPFLMLINVNGLDYEQLLLNVLGPIELWALSTTPLDTALRGRLYTRIGSTEARRRLARVFPKGTAVHEIERRKTDRLKPGEDDEHALASVVDLLADELIDGHGLGIVLRPRSDEADSA